MQLKLGFLQPHGPWTIFWRSTSKRLHPHYEDIQGTPWSKPTCECGEHPFSEIQWLWPLQCCSPSAPFSISFTQSVIFEWHTLLTMSSSVKWCLSLFQLACDLWRFVLHVIVMKNVGFPKTLIKTIVSLQFSSMQQSPAVNEEGRMATWPLCYFILSHNF